MKKTSLDTTLPIVEVQLIKAETMQSRVHAQLRELLMLGRFQPGQALKIYDLAQAFGTSVQPVRESIRQLVTERALEALPNRSARVPQLTVERLSDLLRVRMALEGLAAEMAAERITGEEIARLRSYCEAEAEADDRGSVEASVHQNMQFHFTLYRAAGSDTLMPFIESLWLQIGPWVRKTAEGFDAGDGRGTIMHWQALEALERRDATATRKAIEDDITRTFELVMSDIV
ncbi:MAG: GntR family transcriptional regulator [Pararhodobacter sp.]